MPSPTASPDAGEAPASWRRRWTLLAINAFAFGLLYGATNLAAARAGVTRSLALAWDARVPHWPWMLPPYLSSVPVLVAACLLARDRRTLDALSQRALAVVVVATFAFSQWPARVADSAPFEGPWRSLQAIAHAVDLPYNQCPSLHVAYAALAWPALSAGLSSRIARTLLAAGLLLVAASTVLTGAHHLVDVPAGALLGLLACRWLPVRTTGAAVALHYALAALASLTLGATLLPAWLGAWLAAGFAGVALAYARGDGGFLRKREGRLPAWALALYAPYLLGYGATWLAVRWRDRGTPPFRLVAPGLWVGRRLDAREAARLPADCAVVDVSAELPATPALRGRPYACVPLLDIVAPPDGRLDDAVAAIARLRAAGRPVYLHCAMGRHRSRAVAAAWLARQAAPT